MVAVLRRGMPRLYVEISGSRALLGAPKIAAKLKEAA
jgi:hypothetical protein